MVKMTRVGARPYCVPDDRIHALFFGPSLGGGGAEMQILRMLNQLDRRRFRLSLALARGGGAYESALAADVTVHHLPTGGINSSTLRMVRAIAPLRRLIQAERPDILCSFMDHANLVALLATRALSQRPATVLTVQNVPSAKYWRLSRGRDRLFAALVRGLYPRGDQIVAISHGIAEELITFIPQLRDAVRVIYNACVDERLLAGAQEPLPEKEQLQGEPLLVACGRLVEQKDFPTLIDAFARVRQTIPAHLWIIGEGRQRGQLEQQIQALGLADRVRLLGLQVNPFKYMAAADLFVMSSIYEGLGMVLVEAMACGTAVVSTACPYGPQELIADGFNGLLAPPANAEALAAAISRALTDEPLRQRLALNGAERARAFHVAAIAPAYEALFTRCVSRRRALVQV